MRSSVVKFMVTVREVLKSIKSHVGTVYVLNVTNATTILCTRKIKLKKKENTDQSVEVDSEAAGAGETVERSAIADVVFIAAAAIRSKLCP